MAKTTHTYDEYIVLLEKNGKTEIPWSFRKGGSGVPCEICKHGDRWNEDEIYRSVTSHFHTTGKYLVMKASDFCNEVNLNNINVADYFIKNITIAWKAR